MWYFQISKAYAIASESKVTAQATAVCFFPYEYFILATIALCMIKLKRQRAIINTWNNIAVNKTYATYKEGLDTISLIKKYKVLLLTKIRNVVIGLV